MRRFSLILFLFIQVFAHGQKVSWNVEALSNWFDVKNPFNGFHNTYNEVWGFVWNGSEYAVIGARSGTYILDVTEAEYPRLVRFIEGDSNVINRDYHDFNGHLYMVADQGKSSTFQILDFRGLPDSTNLVYDSDELFDRCHNIFIDSAAARLYACSVKRDSADFGLETLSSDLHIYDISEPASPKLLLDYDAVDVFHDIYVKNDTAFGNNAREGMFVYDFTDLDDPKVISSVIDYPEKGYNHSGWTTEDGKYYFFADETHGSDIKVCDVTNIRDIDVVAVFNSETDSMAMVHNLIVKGDYLYISYYHDGFQLYDIKNPEQPLKVGFYDTYLSDDYTGGRGAWGVYPFLPSGHILISDREKGLFVLDPTQALLSVDDNDDEERILLDVYPNPFSSNLQISLLNGQSISDIYIYDMQGRLVAEHSPINRGNITLQGLELLHPGMYVMEIRGDNIQMVKKLIKSAAP